MRRRVWAGLVAVACIGGSTAATVGIVSTAGATTAVLAEQTFAGTAVATPWALLATPFSHDTACLTNTGASTSATPVPGCGVATPPVDGLAVAGDAATATGGVVYAGSVPVGDGLDATFDAYLAGPTGGDGLTFFLAAVDPTGSAAGTRVGPGGGHLGYSGGFAAPTGTGVTHAYLGVGLDQTGNFATAQYAGSQGCTGGATGLGAKAPDAVDVRGPGNSTTGYCLLGSTAKGAALGGTLHSVSAKPVPVQVAVNPTATAITVTHLVVPADSWAVAVHPIVATGATGPAAEATCPSGARCLSGALPSASHSQCPAVTAGNGQIPTATIPCTWLDENGVPEQLVFGWTGATGPTADHQLVTDASVSTLAGVPTTYELTLAASTGTQPVVSGESLTFTAQATVGATSEHDQVTLSDRLPAGLSPVASADTLPGGSCATTATTQTGSAVESCTYTPPVGGLPVDSVLTATFHATVSAPALSAARSLTDHATITSSDSSPATATASVVFAPSWSVSVVDNVPGAQAVPGSPVEFTATPSLSAQGAAEADAITLTDTFPAELVPTSASGTGWTCTAPSAHTLTCSLPVPRRGFPAGPTASVHFNATVSGTSRGTQTEQVQLTSSDGGTASGSASIDVVTNQLVFENQPVTVQLNGTMEQGNAPLQLQVGLEATGVPVTGVTGPIVTLHLTPDPGNARFEVNGGPPTSTLTAALDDGVATFPAFGLTGTGTGFRLVATSPGVVSTRSTPFGSDDVVAACGGGTCTTTVSTPSGVTVTVTVPGAAKTTVVIGNFGTTGTLLLGCPGGTIHQILKVTAGNQQLVVLYQLTTGKSRRLLLRAIPFCYGSTAPFTTANGRPSAFNSRNGEYEGPLPMCRVVGLHGPCILSERVSGRIVSFKVLTTPGDPRFDASH